MASLHINLDSTLGAAFLGGIVAGIFYGITCVQAFIYYEKNYKDSVTFRILILFLWLLDTFHLALITHGLYRILISNYGNVLVALQSTWSIHSQVYVTLISDAIIRAIFGRRVWLFTERNKFVAGAIFVTSALTCVTGFIFVSRARRFSVRDFEDLARISYLFYISLGSGVVAEMTIAGLLCTSLWRRRTGFKGTDSLVGILMMYTINTTLLTTISSAACFITYTIWPQRYTFMGIYFSLSKLFLNSLLANLNSREAFKNRLNDSVNFGLSDLVFKPLDISSRGIESLPKSRRGSQHSLGSQSVVINIIPQLEVEDPPRRAGTTDLAR